MSPLSDGFGLPRMRELQSPCEATRVAWVRRNLGPMSPGRFRVSTLAQGRHMAKSAPVKAPKAAPKSKKPRTPMTPRQRRIVALSAGGIVLLLLAAGAVVFVMTRGLLVDSGGRLTVSKDFGNEPEKGAERGAAGSSSTPAVPGEERTYTVKPGENLWGIASKGGLVDSAWEWRTILVQNRDKIQYAFLSEEDGGWKVMVEDGQQLKVTSDSSPGLPGAAPATGKLYAVQMLTVPDTRLERAVRIVHQLIADGHFAYLYRKEADGKRFYRIRVGFYATPDDAMQAGEGMVAKYSAQKLFKEYWVMRPSDVELQGGHLDYGVQEARPWVVELPPRNSHHDALEDLRKISGASEFAYIAQKRDGTSSPAHYLYRTRIGFFANEGQAKAFITAHKSDADVLAQGQAVRIEDLQEALPGQNLRLGKPAAG
jgi:hypothetical protein